MKSWLRTSVLAATVVIAAVVASSAFAQNYVVLYKGQSVPANASTAISAAGGKLVYSYGQIGVVIASSDSAGG